MFLNPYWIYWHRFWIDFDQILDFQFLDLGKAGQTQFSWIRVQILPILGLFWFLRFLGSRFSELFSKKSTLHGPSGQTAMWKMIPYGSFSFQVFVKKCWTYLFLPIRFHFFMITLFSPFVRLKPVQAGICVSIQTVGVCWEYIGNILGICFNRFQ